MLLLKKLPKYSFSPCFFATVCRGHFEEILSMVAKSSGQ